MPVAPTLVIFRKWRQKNGSIIALFPEIPADHVGLYCSSYEHVGQHGAADYVTVMQRSKPAMPSEYADLKKELESNHYKLRVIKRRNRKVR